MINPSAIEFSASHPCETESSGSIRVVIIDDSEDFRIVICELLKMLFAIEIVGVGSNGFEALELTAQKAPDLVIMDVNMPVLDGISAAGLIRHHFPTTTILMMSGDDSPEMRGRCLRVGADGFTPKRWLAKQVAQMQPGLCR
jgi:DNA-binding NarL/FixJ family response regulator